jgi:hypothetical protein
MLRKASGETRIASTGSRESLFKADHPRPIDLLIDYFGDSRCGKPGGPAGEQAANAACRLIWPKPGA